MIPQPITCQYTLSLLLDYVEEKLHRSNCELIEVHLKDCPRCREFLHSYHRTPEVCRRATSLRLPQRTTQQLWLRIKGSLPAPEDLRSQKRSKKDRSR